VALCSDGSYVVCGGRGPRACCRTCTHREIRDRSLTMAQSFVEWLWRWNSAFLEHMFGRSQAPAEATR